MARVIALDTVSGVRIWVNPDYIVALRSDRPDTTTLEVKGIPNKIADQIRGYQD